jgi:hypothetical protein
MHVRFSRWALLVALVLASAVANRAATSSTTLAVTGRANAHVSLAADGQFVAAVWAASAPAGDTDIFAATSRDGGTMFTAPIRVNSTPGDARVNGEQPARVAVKPRPGQTPEIAVVWTTKGSAGTKLCPPPLTRAHVLEVGAVLRHRCRRQSWMGGAVGPGGL